jgi:hypothetical protein
VHGGLLDVTTIPLRTRLLRILGYLLLALLLPAVLLSGLVVVLCEDVNRWLGAGVGVQR